MKKATALLLILVLLCSLCGAQAAASSPEGAGLPVAGSYVLYSILYGGEEHKPSEYSISSSISLDEGGGGMIDMNGGVTVISKWEAADGVVTLYNESGVPLPCTVQDGILTLEMGENYYWYYAHEGTGITDPDAGRQFESLLYALRQSVDADSGAHLRYMLHTDYLDSTSSFDVHARGGVFFSDRVTSAGGYEQRSASFFKDGTAYVLYPDELRGNVAAATGASVITENVLMLDGLYQTIYTASLRGDYSVETREIEGVSYTAEVFPETSYKPQIVFCYGEDGGLAFVFEGAPKLTPEMGESVYTVLAIDEAVDDSLLDISAYTIS